MSDISLRLACRDDARGFADLSTQLGYPCDEATMARRLDVALQSPDHAVYAGMRDRELAGWVHVMRTFHLESGHGAEIAGLVVAERSRRLGLGACLARQAAKCAAAWGFDQLRVRSNTRRTGAHALYRHLGYDTEKVQYVFIHTLAPSIVARP